MPILVPDVASIRRKLGCGDHGVGSLWARFRRRLDEDAAFRASNLFLPALLGEPWAVEEARRWVAGEGAAYQNRGHAGIEHHTWCFTPQVMRIAVYWQWLNEQQPWSDAETRPVAEGLLHAMEEHAVNVLRGRVPAADNQTMSMALSCAVIGHVFHDRPGFAQRAAALRDFGVRRMETALGLSPRDGYLWEGSTYQSHVVSPIVMWAAAFLAQLRGPDVLRRRWAPGGATLLDILRVEHLLGSPGLLMPPWDNYGWQHQVNLAAIAWWATAAGRPDALAPAADIWDRETFIAWVPDDRMWALIYWPDGNVPGVERPRTLLAGWSLPSTAAVIDHAATRSRLMLAFDSSSTPLQAIGRMQVNPNHVLYEIAGEPVFGDGPPASREGFLNAAPEQVAAPLSAAQRELLARQYGSVANWACAMHQGLIGAANTVLIDGEEGYFPMGGRHGRVAAESRNDDRHVITAESLDYFKGRYDLTRALRTIAMNRDGVCWIVDDYRAASPHRFTWQTYLRRGATLDGSRCDVAVRDGLGVTLAWSGVDAGAIDAVPGFPGFMKSIPQWPEGGSDRLRLTVHGTRLSLAVCLVPTQAAGLAVEAVRDGVWKATWRGGSDVLDLTGLAELPPPAEADPPESVCDLDDMPFGLSDEPNDTLLARLDAPQPDDWRKTAVAIQTLAVRGVAAAWPKAHRLLTDDEQRYHVHSAAAWALGRAGYAPALDDLRFLSNSPETNTAFRAAWAAERIAAGR